jgi:hypothetical protein
MKDNALLAVADAQTVAFVAMYRAARRKSRTAAPRILESAGHFLDGHRFASHFAM